MNIVYKKQCEAYKLLTLGDVFFLGWYYVYENTEFSV